MQQYWCKNFIFIFFSIGVNLLFTTLTDRKPKEKILGNNIVSGDYFQKLFGNNSNNFFGKGIEYNNFYYIIGGNNGMATLTKLSNTGDHIWTSQVNGTSAWNDIIVNSDGNVLLVGIYGAFDGMAESMIGVVHQSTGNFISLKSMDFSHRESLTKIYLNPSPANTAFPYNLIGVQNNANAASDDITIMTLNKDGNIGLRRIIDSGNDDEFYRDISPDGNNGEMIITGNRLALNNNGITLTLDKNGQILSGRLFNVNTTFNTMLTKQNLSVGNNHILAGKNNTSNVAQIVKVNGNSMVFSHDIIQLNTITRLYPMGLSNFIAIGYGIFSGVNRPVMVHMTDSGNSLIINWAKTFNDGENQYGFGFGNLISPNKYMYTDARNGNSDGFGNMDAFISIDDINLDNCLDQNVSVSLTETSVSFSSFNPTSTLHEQMTNTERTGTLLSYNSSDLCAFNCEVSFAALNQNCGTVNFNSNTNLPTPVTYQWTFGTTPQTTSTIANPIKKYPTNGTYNVCLTVTNGINSCTNCKSITVSNADIQAPILNCPSNIQLTNNPGKCYANFAPIVSVTDNCDPNPSCNCIMSGATTGEWIKNSNVLFNVGQTSITCTAKDNVSNSATCTFNIRVFDSEPPVIKCPPDVSLTCSANPESNEAGMATASDNCPQLSLSYSDIVTIENCKRIISRTWRATDQSGSIVSCIQRITFVDNKSPDMICPSDVIISCSSSAIPEVTGFATAMDSCQTNVAINFKDVISGSACNQIIQRTWTATDPCGNKSLCIQTITKKDNVAPVITCPANVSVACTSSTTPSVTGQASATDNCQTNITITFSDTKSCTLCDSTIIRTWTASDNCGNTSSCIQTITKKDNVAPIITCPANVSVACTSSTTPSVTGQASATDNCQTNITITFSDTKSCTLCDSTIIRTWTASDNCGNTSSCIQTITKKDNVAPIITCPANVSVACNSSTAPSVTGQASATDNCQTNITITFSDTKSGTPCDSTIIRTWTASDNCGNTSSCIQTITKKDNVAPVITCPANVSVACNSSTAPSVTGQASATDNCQTNITITFSDTKSGTPCDSIIIRTWTASGNCGNTSSCIQTITKKDNVAPVITCPANVSVACNSSTAPSVTGQASATYNCQTNITITFSDTKSGTPCDSIIIRTWTASDNCGNTSSCTQTITKKDNVAPVITCPANVSVACNSSTATSVTGQASATDNCQTNITITFSDTKSGTPCDSTIIRTWTASDNCGNTSSCTQSITKKDNVAPAITCPANVSVACNSSTATLVTGQASATDNCKTNITIAYSDIKSGTPCDSTIIRTWTASDNCGNTSLCTQTITKKDNVAPVITCPANVSVACNSSTAPSVTGQANSTDNCQSNIIITFFDTKSGTLCDSTIIRTWTASDNCGNISSCTQTITKKDNVAPVIACPANISVACNSSTTTSVTGQASATSGCPGEVNITYSDQKMILVCDTVIKRTWTVQDKCNNTASCVQNITLLSDMPVATDCGRHLFYTGVNVNNSCFANVTIPSPTFSSRCLNLFSVTNDFTGTNNASGLYQNGNTIILWEAIYSCGLKVLCRDTVTVSDCPANPCCTDENDFADLLKKEFNFVTEDCNLTISTNQFDSCHYIISIPDFGEGLMPDPDTISANGIWYYTYKKPGNYKVCMNIIAKDSDEKICQKGQICKTIVIDCLIPNICCTDTISFLTSVQKNIAYKKAICDLCFPMKNVDSCDFYTIDFGDGSLPFEFTGDSVCHNYAVKDTYNVCIKAFRQNEFSEICLQKDTCFKVYISCDPNEFCDISEIKVPNGLTPNGDNINDLLKIVKPASCGSIDISIYNRWGQLVWAKSGYENEWDGRSINGNPLPDGTYYLILSLPSPGTDFRSFKTFIDIRSR